MIWIAVSLVSIAFLLILAMGLAVGAGFLYLYKKIEALDSDGIDSDITTLATAVAELQEHANAMGDAFRDFALAEEEVDVEKPITIEDLILAHPHPECFDEDGEPITDVEYIALVDAEYFYDSEEMF